MKRKFTFLIAAALMLLTMMATTGTMWGQTRSVTYEATTSIAVDDVVLLVAESSNYKKELSGFTTSGTIYGTVSDYTQTPNGVYPLTVVSGNSEGSFAFMNSDNKYLSWSSGNSLQLSETLNDNSSWTFNYAYTVTTITNVGTTARQIKYNSSSPRFACYTSGQQSIKLYKQVSSSLTDNDIALTGAPVALSFDLYNNSAAQTINYTTSSTGAVTIADNQYINTEIDEANKTITVTPVKVTPSAQTITVNQAADANYAAGSTIFTVNITNSAPYDQPTEIEALLNNDLFGTNYTGPVSGITDNNPIVGTKDNVTVTYAGSGNHYVNNSQIRFYPSNKLTFEAPSGYEIKQIVFTSAGTWAATISANGGTYNSSTKTWTGSATSVLFTGSGSSRCDMSKADIIIGAVSSLPTPTITIDATGITNTNVFDSTDAGSLSATVTYNDETVQGATVTWSGNNNAVATIDENSGAVTLVAAGSVTFTATFAGNESYNSATAQHVMTVTNDDPNAPGTVNNPYTVAAAMAATPTSGTSANVYIHGIVSAFYNTSIVGDGSNYRYYISDDGTTTSQLLVYKGKGLNNEAFSKADDLLIGDEIILFGGLTMYQNAPEVAANNYIVSLERPVQDVATPTFSVAAGTYASAQEVEISCETDGATIYYTLDGTEPTEASTPYNGALNIETTTTVKAIAYKNTANSYVATATYHICSAETPYTVAQALAFNEYPTSTIWVHGIVSTAPTTAPSSGQLKYYISDNGEATNELYIYNGKGLNNAAFTAQDDIQVGDIVTITGFVKDYQGTLEFDSGNYLTSFERPTVATPTFTPGEGEYTEAQSVTIACATEGATIYYKTAENAEWAIYSEAINVAETTTIWAYAAKEGMNNSAVATATYTINIPILTASITVDPALVEATADGGEGTLTVTYTNITEINADVYFCNENGDAATYGDWIQADINENNNVYYVIGANDGEARTAYFKVYALDDNAEDVYSNLVTINQAAYIAPSQEVVDVLDNSFTGITGTTYTEWTNTGTSDAVYVGFSAGQNSTIQLRTKNSNEGIITTTSGGKVTKVEVTWNDNTSSGRKLDIYGKNTAYSEVSDLYNNEKQGTKLGTIEYDNNTALIITDDYEFIGIRSNSGALYLDEIQITWSTGSSTEPSITVADATVEVPAEGEDNGILALTYANLTITEQGDFDIQYYDENGDELGKDDQPDWMEASIQAAAQEGYEVSFSVVENEGEARTAYFKVYALDDDANMVYSNLVTITQDAPLPTYTVSFYVNGTPDGSLTGSSITLPTESSLTPAGFSIAGWAEEGSTIAVADPYTPTDNVNLYALFQLDNAQTTSGNFVKVTEELTDWSGEYLIVYEDGNVAFNGILETFDAVENTVNVEIASSTIIANDAMNNASFTIAPMTDGYSIQGTSGKYIGVGSYANGLTTNDDPVANAISIDESGNALITITFTGGDMTLKYNDAENQLRFRYYKSGQKDIQLYKKESTSFNTITILDNTIPEQTISDPIPNATCVVVPNNVTLTYTGPNPSTPEALVVQEGGQLIHEADVEATIQKGVFGYTNKSGDGWYLISSPVDNLPTSSVATGTYDLFAYDEATAYWWVDHAIPGQPANHTFTTLERGKGYLYANAANVNLNYAGTMKATDANFTVDLSFACGEYPDLKGFNLVGNPFTRNITAADMVIGEDAVTSYYDFNADRTEFVTYQINERPIQPGQGFFIQATASEQKLVFNPTTPPTKDASDFKYISISAGDENFTDKAYIQFGYGNTLRKMTFGENTMVYVMNNDDDYAAARVEELAGTMPVHFVPIEDGFYTITVETKNIENLNYMHLIDNITNTDIDLLAEPSYTFKASESDNADRFYLVFDFNNYTNVEESFENSHFAYQFGDELILNGNGTLQVFDIMGRFVMSREINGSERISTTALNAGVYVLRLNDNIQKIVVR